MSNVISIVNAKESKLDFEVGIEGLEPKNIKVRLLIEANDYALAFSCKKEKGEKTWGVTIPALDYIEKGAYPFKVEVIVDGYHFEAMKGVANVTGTFDVYARKVEKIKPIEEKKIPQRKIGEMEAKRERSTPLSGMNALADKIFAEYKNKPKTSEKSKLLTEGKTERKTHLDDTIRSILQESSSTYKNTKSTTFKKGKVVQY